jgi:hypothetical protein
VRRGRVPKTHRRGPRGVLGSAWKHVWLDYQRVHTNVGKPPCTGQPHAARSGTKCCHTHVTRESAPPRGSDGCNRNSVSAYPEKTRAHTTHTNRSLFSQGCIVPFESKIHTMVCRNCAAPELWCPLPPFLRFLNSTASRLWQLQLSSPSTATYVAVHQFFSHSLSRMSTAHASDANAVSPENLYDDHSSSVT